MKLTAGLASLAVRPTAEAIVGCRYAKEPTLHNVDCPSTNKSCRFQNCCHSPYTKMKTCADLQQSDDALTTHWQPWGLCAAEPKVPNGGQCVASASSLAITLLQINTGG